MKNPIDLAAEAAAFADQYQMLPQGSTVLCAVSGGKDSMALLSVLQTLAPERNLMIHAAHFNHQLRGEESQRDEDFVRSAVPEADFLGCIHYNPEIMDADRLGKSPYDFCPAAIEEIRKIKAIIDRD